MTGEPSTALVATLEPEELRAALNDVLTVVGEFVRHIADYNLVSERAVLRSMGVEPDANVDDARLSEKAPEKRNPEKRNAARTHQRASAHDVYRL
jgi:hypothetical protein